MLGPLASGIVYVKRSRFEQLRPLLLGASNVRCPDYVAQSEMVFPDTAARYESGVLNLGPILGMKASLDFLLGVGLETVAARVQGLVGNLAASLGELGFEPAGPIYGPNASGILSLKHPSADLGKVFERLQAAGVTVSLRRGYLRWSPHVYNTEEEIARAVELVRGAM